MSSRKKIIISFFTIGLLCLLGVILLFYNGMLLFNNPSNKSYPVRGVDVSSYQGEIDWNVLAEQKIQFAFMKATEGSSFVDPCFENNYKNATKSNLKVGAYHFFSYDSKGIAQAEKFISVVPNTNNMLPPVVDVEFYGDKDKNPPDKKSTQLELTAMLLKLEEHYGIKPIIYATEKSYQLYITNSFEHNDIWIRNVISKPKLKDKRQWTFWQYTNREVLQGFHGKEKFIDMNVFNGNQNDFNIYIKNNYGSKRNEMDYR